ncbi:CaiB/BaiF CoA transferase family protein [Nocardia sp. NPDC058379]|uniref:CaiB/BaiF CoA transferase family protein n=1 Tax=unclassified Nocardia TaxID=2637762 RepID=UPI00364DD56F
MSTERAHGPLAGVTVIGLEQAIAAPLCTRHLADLGARVIKIEQPGSGDSTRHYDTVVGGLSAHFTWLNHGKESAALDLREAEDLALLERMLGGADVLVSNLGPGALDRLGLGVGELARRYPRLIIVDISGYGRGGPFDHKRAYDLLVQAEAGSCTITGTPGHPAKPGIPVADIGTALYSYSAVLAALYDRERTGRGAIVPVAMLDVVSEMMGFALNQFLHTGTEPLPVGMGSPMIAPYGSYPTADGQVAVLGTTSDREWRRLTELMDRPDLAADARYAHNDDRVACRAELDAAVGKWCAERTLAEIQAAADAAGIGNARLNGVRELAEHPQLRDRGRWREIGTPSGPVPALLPPGTALDWPAVHGSVPALGADTAALRAEFAPESADV